MSLKEDAQRTRHVDLARNLLSSLKRPTKPDTTIPCAHGGELYINQGPLGICYIVAVVVLLYYSRINLVSSLETVAWMRDVVIQRYTNVTEPLKHVEATCPSIPRELFAHMTRGQKVSYESTDFSNGGYSVILLTSILSLCIDEHSGVECDFAWQVALVQPSSVFTFQVFDASRTKTVSTGEGVKMRTQLLNKDIVKKIDNSVSLLQSTYGVDIMGALIQVPDHVMAAFFCRATNTWRVCDSQGKPCGDLGGLTPIKAVTLLCKAASLPSRWKQTSLGMYWPWIFARIVSSIPSEFRRRNSPSADVTEWLTDSERGVSGLIDRFFRDETNMERFRVQYVYQHSLWAVEHNREFFNTYIAWVLRDVVGEEYVHVLQPGDYHVHPGVTVLEDAIYSPNRAGETILGFMTLKKRGEYAWDTKSSDNQTYDAHYTFVFMPPFR